MNVSPISEERVSLGTVLGGVMVASLALIACIGPAWILLESHTRPATKTAATTGVVLAAAESIQQGVEAKAQLENSPVGVSPASALVSADEKRHQAVAEHVAEVDRLLRSLPIYSGAESFATEALGLQSKAWSASDPSAHRRWLGELFSEQVLPPKDIESLILEQAVALEQDLALIDDDLLLELKLDVDFDSRLSTRPTLNLDQLRNAIASITNDVQHDVQYAAAEELAILAGGWVVEGVMQDLAEDHFASQNNGELGFWQKTNATAVGMLSGFLFEEVVKTTMDTQGQLESTVADQARKAISMLRSGGAHASSWQSAFHGLAQQHSERIAELLPQEPAFNAQSL